MINCKVLVAAILTILCFCNTVPAHEWSSGRPDGHAPVGVMAEHMHKKGEWMLSYRFMHMDMDGSRDGTNRLKDNEVLADFPVTPTEMTMDMHMAGLMYAPLNRVTMMLMIPYVFNEMDHVTRSGIRFTTKSEGLGDIRLTGLIGLLNAGPHRIHFNAGVSFPTGSINERDDTPAGENQRLPYPMQIGSGTFDLLPGVTYLGQTEGWSWGGQVTGTIRLGENDNDYTLGNRIQATGWIAKKWTAFLSSSLRLDLQSWDDIDGADPRLNPNLIPTADPDLRAGTRIDLLLGTNVYIRSGFLKGHRLALEGGLPVYQDLDGPQLETDWLVWAGWQYAW